MSNWKKGDLAVIVRPVCRCFAGSSHIGRVFEVLDIVESGRVHSACGNEILTLFLGMSWKGIAELRYCPAFACIKLDHSATLKSEDVYGSSRILVPERVSQ